MPVASAAWEPGGGEFSAQHGGGYGGHRAARGSGALCGCGGGAGGDGDRALGGGGGRGCAARAGPVGRALRARLRAAPGDAPSAVCAVRGRGAVPCGPCGGSGGVGAESEAGVEQRGSAFGAAGGDGAAVPSSGEPGQRGGDAVDAHHRCGRWVAARVLGGEQPGVEGGQPAGASQQSAHEELGQGQHGGAGGGERAVRGGGAVLGGVPRRRDPATCALRGLR